MRLILISLVIISFSTSCASPRPWNKQEKVAAGFNVLGIMADAYATENMLDNSNHYELNPSLGEHPTDTQLAIYFPITVIITLGLSHFYPKLRKPLLFGYGSLSFGAAISNQHRNQL